MLLLHFIMLLGRNVLPPLVGLLYRPIVTVHLPQIQFNEQAVVYL